MLTTDIEEDKAKVLLTMIVDLFVTVRGFFFTKSFMEMYKQVTKKSTQKSKALRKTQQILPRIIQAKSTHTTLPHLFTHLYV